MSKRDPERMAKLLARNRLKKRAIELVKVWAAHGVAVSPVAHDQYLLQLGRLTGQLRWLEHPANDLVGAARAFVAGSDMLTMLGWDVRNEPALLVSASKLAATASNLSQIYPDGFVLINDTTGKAFIADIDDENGTRFNIADLPNTAL